MKITPLEVRQKTFEKKFRGYDKDEVHAFLLSLSNEWGRVLDENKECKIKLEQAEKEVQKLREIENSLFKTLKAAEDTGANLIGQANRAAELHLQETEIKAEAILIESKSKARSIIERAEMQAKEMIEEMQEALKDLEKNYRTLENQKDNLLAELKILSTDIMDRLERTSSRQNAPFKIEDHMKRVREMVRESERRISEQRLETTDKPIAYIPSIDSKDVNSTGKLQKFIEARHEKPKYALQTGKDKTLPASTGNHPAGERKPPVQKPVPKNSMKPAPDLVNKKAKIPANNREADSPKPSRKPAKHTGDDWQTPEDSFFDSL